MATRWLILICLLAYAGAGAAGGVLVAAGGGSLPDSVVSDALELAGGRDAKVVIIPHASNSSDRGEYSEDAFRDAGARDLTMLSFSDRQRAHRTLQEAALIWFSGGKQQRLIAALREAGVVELIQRRLSEGAVVGGSSAGAAVLSEVMVAGTPKRAALRHRNTSTHRGLGVAPLMLIDQHFVKRERFSRLLSALLDHPTRVGLGIGVNTAVIWRDGELRVYGEGSVVVMDARHAAVEPVADGEPQLARDIRMHVLGPDSVFCLGDDRQELACNDRLDAAVAH